MKKLLLIAAASTAILSSTVSFAECDMNAPMDSSMSSSIENQWYLKLNAGAVIFDKQKDRATELKMKSNTGFTGEIGFGYYLMDNLRTDLTVGAVTSSHFKKSGTKTTNTFLGTYSSTQTVKHKPTIISFLLNGYVDFIDLSMFKVFAGGGIGSAIVKEKISYKEIESLGERKSTETFPEVTTRNKTNFAYQLSVGTSFEVAPGMKAELVYSWRDYGKTKIKKVDGTNEGGTRYRGNNLMAGLRLDI